MTPPLLEAKSLRIAIGGVTVSDALSFASRGHTVCMVGAEAVMAPLYQALVTTTGPQAQVLAGELLLTGKSHDDACQSAALAPLDCTVPAKLTVSEYLGYNAQLAGAGQRQAKVRSELLLNQLQLERWQSRKLHNLARVERRVLALLAAFVTGRSPLICSRPFETLNPEESAFVAVVLTQLMKHRETLLNFASLPQAPSAQALVRGASDVLVFREGKLLAQAKGDAIEAALRLFELHLLRPNKGLEPALVAAGASVAGTATRLVVRLPEGLEANDLLRFAEEQQAIVTGLVPLVA